MQAQPVEARSCCATVPATQKLQLILGSWAHDEGSHTVASESTVDEGTPRKQTGILRPECVTCLVCLLLRPSTERVQT